MSIEKSWYAVSNIDEVDSPALILYPNRVDENIRRMVSTAGGAERLCPHVKTHKLGQLVRRQMESRITKFKCATIAEAEMVADCGVLNVMLAYQPVGPKLHRLIKLIKKFPKTIFSTIADDAGAIEAMSKAATEGGVTLSVLVDIDCGMHRSGIAAGDNAENLYRLIASLPGLTPGGLHIYDGHISDTDLTLRAVRCEAAIAPALAMRDKLKAAGLAVPRVVAGGTPTLPIHAKHQDLECSPGTSVLWDWGYEQECPDLKFIHAALVMTRIISKPGLNLVCLDLGHKAIAAEKPHPRVIFPTLPDAKAVTHSEEHLVIETARAGELSVGDCLFGIPRHVCPTVALYAEAVVIEEGKAQARWPILARNRALSI